MKYFIDPSNGGLYAYEADDSQDEYIKPGLQPITKEEADERRKAMQPGPVYREMSSLDFLRLFDPERRAIKQAAMQNVDIGIWHDDTVAAQFITYSDPRVEQGLASLVAAKLLTPARKAEIVAAMTAG